MTTLIISQHYSIKIKKVFSRHVSRMFLHSQQGVQNFPSTPCSKVKSVFVRTKPSKTKGCKFRGAWGMSMGQSLSQPKFIGLLAWTRFRLILK